LALSHNPSSNPALTSPGDSERHTQQAAPLLAFVLAAFFAVIIFLPPEGRIGVPLHDGLAMLLGRATFMLPLALAFTGVLLVVRALRPAMPLPRRRLTGIGLLALAALPSEDLLGTSTDNSGLIGHWLSTWLLDLVGGPATLVLLVAVLGVGVLLTFDVRLLRVATPSPPRPNVPAGGQWRDAER
jgi:hypothetical protein